MKFTSGFIKTYLKPKDTENNNTGENRCSTVDQRDHDGIPMAVVVHRVVTGHSNQPSKGHTQGEENLSGSLQPNLWINELVEL